MLTSKAVATAPVTTTMLPFLYQTKTLSYLFSTTPAAPPRHVRNLPRYLSTSRRARAFDPDSIPVTTPARGNDGEPEPAKPSTSNRTWDLNASSAGAQRVLPRKVLSQSAKPSRSIYPKPGSEKFDDKEFSMPTTIDFEGEVPDSFQPRESTITFREKVAFQKIFTDILERTQKTRPKRLGAKDGQVESLPTYSKMGDEKVKTALSDILASAISSPKSRLELEEAINTYPPVLRGDAAKALLVGQEVESDSENHGKDTIDGEARDAREAAQEAMRAKAEELEALRGPERLRVETLMRNAKTDFELWDIMEREVFSMISKLGLEENGKTPEPPNVIKKQKGWRKLEKQQEMERKKNPHKAEVETTEQDVVEKEEEIKDNVLPLQLYGPLYPSYLLLGLRLLDRSFAKPSPLALSILPKIKSLGFISHVLGASTQFYNDLLRIYRYRYDDFRGMIALMHEMESSALDMDDETVTIVLDVLKIQGSVSGFEKGNAVKALWRMPEFAPGRFGTWRDKISREIAERKRNSGGGAY